MGLQYLAQMRDLHVEKLAQLLDRTTNSYKYLFFIAILNEIKSQLSSKADERSCCPLQLPTQHVIREMLAFAWYPHRFFNLSFGVQDQVGQSLDRLNFRVDERAVTHPQTRSELRNAIQEQLSQLGADSFARYVPYRLLSPFFINELKGLPDHEKNFRIAEAAQLAFDSNGPPLYRLVQGGEKLEIHPEWLSYITNNLAIVQGWAYFKWALFLQKRNPSMPSILKKIEPPTGRGALIRQTEFWNQVISGTDQPIHCIYQPTHRIQPGRFQLDHFVPWSFVCHDKLWNLIPAEPAANAAKGRSLPTQEQLGRFISNQRQALQVCLRLAEESVIPSRKWNKFFSSYTEGIGLEVSDIDQPDRFLEKYRVKINPLLSLARQLGY